MCIFRYHDQRTLGAGSKLILSICIVQRKHQLIHTLVVSHIVIALTQQIIKLSFVIYYVLFALDVYIFSILHIHDLEYRIEMLQGQGHLFVFVHYQFSIVGKSAHRWKIRVSKKYLYARKNYVIRALYGKVCRNGIGTGF